MGFNVAIDGPASAGKSTLAKLLAKKMSFIYVDTGAMYRAIGLYCYNNNIDIDNEEMVSDNCHNAVIDIKYVDSAQVLFLNGEDVTSELRKEEVGHAASVTSSYKRVREYLLDTQRSIAKSNDVVMDGRDIGTVVLPNADLKIFLTASSRQRAIRRHKELLEKGINKTVDEVEKDLNERDARDSSRATAPLKQADDAVLINTTNMIITEELDMVISLCKDRIK